jgi:hypothetical protein
VSRRVKDNQLDLVFEGGKLIIPPMIHDRGRVWELINSMPAQVRDDGVPRETQAAADRPMISPKFCVGNRARSRATDYCEHWLTFSIGSCPSQSVR